MNRPTIHPTLNSNEVAILESLRAGERGIARLAAVAGVGKLAAIAIWRRLASYGLVEGPPVGYTTTTVEG